MPEQASTNAGRVDALYFYLVGVTAFFTALIYIVVTFFAIRYRRRTPHEIPRPVAGSMRLETVWSIIPFFISMSMFVWGTSLFFEQVKPPKNAMEVYVVGKQWMWKFQHTTGQREINELHVPIGRKVKLTMTTEDTIHDLFIPDFRIKMDVVPGRYSTEWFEATMPGRHHLFCAEYCGMNHSGMIGWVTVMEPTDFDDWLAGNANQQSPVAAGQQAFQQKLGCASCHGDNGQGGRGPSLINLVGSKVPLDNGQTVVADDAYIRESILFPRAKIVAGYQPIMPTFQGQITEEELLQLISYIKSLSPKTASTSALAPAHQPTPSPSPLSQANQSQVNKPQANTSPAAANANSGTKQQNSNAAGKKPPQPRGSPK
jgi:cytochrome c oxidase subunit 2